MRSAPISVWRWRPGWSELSLTDAHQSEGSDGNLPSWIGVDMDLKLFDVLVAFAGLCLLLLVGTALRQRLRWLRALGIPEALIAGLLVC